MFFLPERSLIFAKFDISGAKITNMIALYEVHSTKKNKKPKKQKVGLLKTWRKGGCNRVNVPLTLAGIEAHRVHESLQVSSKLLSTLHRPSLANCSQRPSIPGSFTHSNSNLHTNAELFRLIYSMSNLSWESMRVDYQQDNTTICTWWYCYQLTTNSAWACRHEGPNASIQFSRTFFLFLMANSYHSVVVLTT